jgi:shikimate kinase / 3-dehydroquinate synthase
MQKIFLYGPPGSGKSSTAHALAQILALPFFDLDREIEVQNGSTIPDIFANQGEAAFREAERNELFRLLDHPGGFVMALGAGALLDEASCLKTQAEGKIICLSAALPALLERMRTEADHRPLLSGDLSSRLEKLLASRTAHYASFPNQLDTTRLNPQEAAWRVQSLAGFFRVQGMDRPYPVLVSDQELETIGSLINECGLNGPVVLVSDQNTAHYYEKRILSSLRQAGFTCHSIVLPLGESAKNLESVTHLWQSFLEARLDRKSTVLALGGGVVTDLAGFAAATYLRGIAWAVVSSTLLGMVDASLGGKTGIDLPQGKNLVGSFHAPRLVIAFPELLASLPDIELKNGLAEVVKHGIIGDPVLFEECGQGWGTLFSQSAPSNWAGILARAIAVKIRILIEDPFEQGRRGVLNYGHTIGHAIEQASGYRLRHGEAVAIGMAVEARIGEKIGITQPGLAKKICDVLEKLDLPTKIPSGLDPTVIRRSLQVDKKNRSGKARLSLPISIGEANEGYEIEEKELWSLFWSCMDPI